MAAFLRFVLSIAIVGTFNWTEARIRRPLSAKNLSPDAHRLNVTPRHTAFFFKDPQRIPDPARATGKPDAQLPASTQGGVIGNMSMQTVAAVAGTTAVASAVCAAYVHRLFRHYLYDQYVRPNAPGIADVLGHVLYTKEDPNVVAMRRKSALGLLKTIFVKLLEKVPWIRGMLKTNIKRIPIGEAIEDGSVTALFFHSNNVQKLLQDKGYRDFTKNLVQIQEAMRASGRKFQVVYVNVDQRSVDAVDHFKDMPWYAIPFGDKKRITHLCQLYDITGIPSVVLVNSDGSVINDRALYLMAHKPNNFPWKVETPLDLIPDTLVNGNNQKVGKDSLKGKIVGVYFGAGWIRSNKDFNEKLQEYYKAVNDKTDGKFEIVYVSNDKTQNEFEKEMYDNNSNWLAVPFEDADIRLILQQYLKVPVMPSLVLFDPSGNVITPDGRFYVEADRGANALPYTSYLNNTEKHYVEDVAVNVDVFAHEPVVIVFADDIQPEEQQNVEMQLNEAAVHHANYRKGRQLKFFISKTVDKRTDAVRSICGEHRANRPQVVILDLLAQRVYHNPKITSIDQNSILTLVDDFYKGNLKSRAIKIEG
ncbi:hypothetical protein X943_001838 [Babesia divergens]|uniref:Thioredoxin-like fold domain-containing protein n=1 Tax=Babesia divergens TaxID=32595 RepID=A0AAD9GHH5_BABDI|nr:hypothetical protein X943_001838 [Babesia divergens]